jgi:hypothetical protein
MSDLKLCNNILKKPLKTGKQHPDGDDFCQAKSYQQINAERCDL